VEVALVLKNTCTEWLLRCESEIKVDVVSHNKLIVFFLYICIITHFH
jgi:hypothetical protein